MLTSLALLATAAQVVTGIDQLVLYLTPLLLIAGFLLAGRYVGEDAIVRRWTAGRAVPVRRRVPAPCRPLPLAPALRSLLDGCAVGVRGPPVVA